MGVIIVADLVVVARRPHVPSMRESGRWVGFYVGLALIYAVAMWVIGGQAPTIEFVAGWLTEYSLSVDNLFVFVLIMTRFAVPRDYQQRVLMVGIVVALILRAAFILAGAAILEQFTWVFYLFGAFLIYTAITMLRSEDDDEEYKESALIRGLRKVLPISDSYDSGHLRTRDRGLGGKRLFTPMIIVFLAIGTTDVLFALDSIPAIFGLTRDPFIVFATNLFALMGLRQLYFLLGGLLERLVYLPIALAVILGFIGVKLILEALHENTLPFINSGHGVHGAPEIPIWLSLTVIGGSLAIATAASLIRDRRRRTLAESQSQ